MSTGSGRAETASAAPFQSLEKFWGVFPIIGNFCVIFSNRWKLFRLVFQSLENYMLELFRALFRQPDGAAHDDGGAD